MSDFGNSAKSFAPSDRDLDLARRQWALAIQKIGQEKLTLSVCLGNSRAIPVGPDAWKIVFQKPFDFEYAKRSLSLISERVAAVAGRKIAIELTPVVHRVLQAPEPKANIADEVPEHLIPISEVYETAQRNWQLQKRAIQWYATEGFIPKPKHVGREAYYDKRTIYSYFTIIHLLSRGRFSFSLSEIRTLIRKLDALKTVSTPGGKLRALAAVEAFILDHSQYEAQIWDIYGSGGAAGDRMLSATHSARISAVREYIKSGLKGEANGIKALLGKTMLDIEAEIQAQDEAEKEIPF